MINLLPKDRRRVSPPMQGPGVRMQDIPQVAMQESRELRNLGRVLNSLGKEFGNLVIKAEQEAIADEVSTAQTDIYAKMGEIEADIRTKNAIELPTDKWGDYAKTQFDKESKTIIDALPHEKSKEQMGLWADREGVRQTSHFTIEGIKQGKQNLKTNMPHKMVNFVENGKRSEFDALVDSVYDEATAAYWKEEAAEYEVRHLAKQTLRTEGYDTAEELVKQNMDVFEPGEADTFLRQLKTDSDIMEQEERAVTTQMRNEAIDKLYSTLGTKESFSQETLDQMPEILGMPEYLAWSKINKGRGRVPTVETDLSAYIDLQDKLFEHWLGQTHSEDSNISLKTEFTKAFYVDKDLNPEAWAELQSYMEMSIEQDYIGILHGAFQDIKSAARGFTSPGSFFRTKDEEQEILKTRRSLTEWLIRERARGKDITPEQVTTRGREMLTSMRKSTIPSEKRKPQSEEMFETVLKDLKSRGEDKKAKDYYATWADKVDTIEKKAKKQERTQAINIDVGL